MESCLELCCRNPSCDVAFMSGLKCYAVECVSDDECESTATDTSETKVLIAHVRTGRKKGNKSSALAGIPKHNTMASKPIIGNPMATKIIPGIQASGSGPLSPQSSVSGKQQPSVNINPGMAGQCKPGVQHKEVAVKGGINAGTYKDIGAVASLDDCSKKCCSYAPCDLAFMLQGRCYLVGCTDGKSCQLQKAKASPYHPSVMYVTRWNNEGVKHTINVADDTKSNYMCSPMKLMKKVTLKGGLKSGDFTDTGKVSNIGECYDLCCQQPTCNLAFMLGQNCFSVKCFNKDLCSTIPAQPSIYNPQIAYVYNRKIVEAKGEGEPASKKTEIIKPAPKCPVGKVIDRVTLVGGLNAGNFHDNGKVKDIQQCRRICCEMPKCNLAFMLGVNCFSVQCKNAAVCKTQPAQPSQFFPRISYVRPFGSNKFMVAEDFNKLSAATAPATKSAIPGLPAPASKSAIPGLPSTADKSAIPGLPSTADKSAIPGLPDTSSKTAIPDLPAPASKPVIPGLIPGTPDKPILPISSSANKPQIPQQTNSQAVPGLPNQPGLPQVPGLPQPAIAGLPVQPSQTLQAALGKASVEPAIGSNLNSLPGQQPNQPGQLLPVPSGKVQNPLLGQLPAGNPLADLPGMSQQLPVHPTPSQTTGVTLPQSPAPQTQSGQATQSPQSAPEQKKAGLPSIPTEDLTKKINLSSTITEAKPGQAMKMNIVDGKLQLTPVESKEQSKKNATSSVGAFDAILGGDDDTDDKCMTAKVVTDVTLKGGKKAGKFKDQGDVKNMKACKKLCCQDEKCNLAFMLEKTCYTVTCKSKDLCNHTPAPPSDFRPRISYVRPLKLSEPKDLPTIPKAPDNLRCKYSNITNNKQFQGPMGQDNFTVNHDANDMPECMAKCCEDKKCDIAYYMDDKCYTVKCSTKDACKPVDVGDKPKNKIPLISAMIMKPKDEPDIVADFESKSSASPDVTDLQMTKERCHSNRISTGITLTNSNQGSNFTSMGQVGSLKKCIALCCLRPLCDIAYLEDNKCFAVQCNDGVMCQSNAHQADMGMNVKMAYMDRNKQPAKERDWMIVYMIVGALAFAAVIGGVIWGVCLCSKRNKIAKQRRLLDDDDEDDEMLPKPTQTRYRTPMHRY